MLLLLLLSSIVEHIDRDHPHRLKRIGLDRIVGCCLSRFDDHCLHRSPLIRTKMGRCMMGHCMMEHCKMALGMKQHIVVGCSSVVGTMGMMGTMGTTR